MSEIPKFTTGAHEQLDFERFYKIVRTLCTKEVSLYPNLWTPDNPTTGCCVAVSLLTQEVFKGELGRISLGHTPYNQMRYHWFNVMPGWEIKDLTREQFGSFNPDYSKAEIKRRERALKIPGAKQSYWLIKSMYNRVNRK